MRGAITQAIRLTGVLSALAALLVAGPAMAQAPGLPRTYQVQRADSPSPVPVGLFSLGMNVVGDLNKDGEEDLLIPQVPGFNDPGQVFVFSGETGQRLDTIPAPDSGGAGGQAQFGLLGIWYVGDDRGSAPFSDLGSCPGGTAGQTCALATIGAPDGVPELIVGATGVDVGGVTDVGRNYVLDGASRAVLKRIDVPVPDRKAGAGFGREPLTPAGMPGCDGNFGVGGCPPASAVPEAVRIGDMDGGGRPDIVLSARRFGEDSTTAHPSSHCARTPGATCAQAGRVYIYRGEEIAGSNPAEVLDGAGAGETVTTLRNLDAQADDAALGANPELFGNDLLPVGDLGRCNAVVPAGDRCPAASTTTTPDGRPDFVAYTPDVDLPAANPDPALANVGVAFLVDGATNSILYEYQHPEPQRGAGFGGAAEQTLAVGDLGDTGLPDLWMAAVRQNGQYVAQGRGYVMNGNYKTAPLINFARLTDPTPAVTEKNFGASVAGVGDLVGGPASPANEVLVGASGPNLVQNVQQEAITDVHFFNPATEKVLQSIPNPDGAIESAFGDSIEPLGDLNEDGFLDFAVGAFRFTGPAGLSQGRVYIFRSDNRPAAGAAPGGGAPAGGTGRAPGTRAPAGGSRVIANMLRPRGSARQTGGRVVVRVSGRLVGTRGRQCGGRVKIGVRFAGNRRVTRVARMGSNCRYSARISIPSRRLPRSVRSRSERLLLRVAARFQGNAQLAPDVSPTTRLTARR